MLTKTLPVAALEIGQAYLERISDALKNLAKWIGVRVGGWFFYVKEGA